MSVKACEVPEEVFNYFYKNEEFAKFINFRHAIVQNFSDKIPNKDKLTRKKGQKSS